MPLSLCLVHHHHQVVDGVARVRVRRALQHLGEQPVRPGLRGRPFDPHVAPVRVSGERLLIGDERATLPGITVKKQQVGVFVARRVGVDPDLELQRLAFIGLDGVGEPDARIGRVTGGERAVIVRVSDSSQQG